MTTKWTCIRIGVPTHEKIKKAFPALKMPLALDCMVSSWHRLEPAQRAEIVAEVSGVNSKVTRK